MLVDIDTGNSRLTPIQILIIYNLDGTIHSVDWREEIMERLDNIPEEDEYDSADDPDYEPGIETDGEPLEYNSSTDDDDDSY